MIERIRHWLMDGLFDRLYYHVYWRKGPARLDRVKYFILTGRRWGHG